MSDGNQDLRTRIAAAIAQADGDIGPDSWDYKLADAVIRELDNMGIIHLSKVRYVTDWVPEGGQESGDDGQA